MNLKYLFQIIFWISTFLSLTQSAYSQSCNFSTTPASPIDWAYVEDTTISGLDISNVDTAAAEQCIKLVKCKNIIIENCKLGPAWKWAIYMRDCENITIRNCVFEDYGIGVYAVRSETVDVSYNSFLNALGYQGSDGYVNGKHVQFNEITGTGNKINYNVGECIMNESTPEDLISVYKSSGVAGDPIQVIGNKLRGGGPSPSGGGIMTGDGGGNYILVKDNILVNPGQYGIGIAGGDNISIIDNKVYGKQQSFTNVGIYIGVYYPGDCTTYEVSGNQSNFTKYNGDPNHAWKSGELSCDTITGWDTANEWGANIDSTILPVNLFCSDVATVPAAPSSLSASALSSSSIQVSWDSVSAATSYVLESSASSGSGFSELATLTGLTYTHTGLASGQTVYYRVKAVNTAGSSSYSSVISGTTEVEPIDSTLVLIEAEDNYTVVTDTGSNAIAIQSYDIHSGNQAVRLYDDGDKIEISFTVDVAGEYEIRAGVRSGGTGNSQGYWPNGYTFEVNDVTTTFTGDVSSISSYYSSAYGGSYMGEMVATVDLTSGTNTVTVEANSSWEIIDYLTLDLISASILPSTPIGLSASALSSSSIQVSWDSASAATSYVLESSASSGSGFSELATLTDSTYTHTGLSSGQTVYYRVKAVNDDGSSVYSSIANATTDMISVDTLLIEAEDNYTVITDAGSNAIAIQSYAIHSGSQAVRLYDNGDKVEISFTVDVAGQYEIRAGVRSGSTGNSQAYWPDGYIFEVNDVTTTFTGDVSSISSYYSSAYGGSYMGEMVATVDLTSGTNTVTVEANSSWEIIDYLTLDLISASILPSTPIGLSASALSSSSIQVSWDSASAATSYVLESSASSGSGFSELATLTDSTYTHTGLSSGQTVYYRVKAVNDDGSSVYSSIANATTDMISVDTLLIEAEDNYTVITDAGSNAIAIQSYAIHSGSQAVRLYDNGDKVEISFTVDVAGQYEIRAGVRSGSTGNSQAYWPDGYIFEVNDVTTTFTGDVSSISSYYSSAYGGSYMGEMVATVNLTSGTNTVTVEADASWEIIDYLKVINASSSRIASDLTVEALNQETNSQQSYLVYPNPFKNSFNLDLSGLGEDENVSLKLYDQTGKLVNVITPTLENNASSVEVSLDKATLKPGLYILKVEPQFSQTRVIKVIKEN
ncbi:fibronectin type III domain-containing protein [Chondrinema litorale]|uniref:fibronectin type III domain-containing protein n=1 Tax=Chondrinema litorale TaxID=2994555 RepID=UPI002543D644|nr:T9SS type A sorting domain-containing protein [Chondrinema litorale]UZR99353.1 T9SS type A sorting domain-containing protein [Chondrinema litorale]